MSYQGFSITQLTQILNVHLNTIYNYLNAWEKEGLLSLYNAKKSGINLKLTNDHEAFIKEKIEENPHQARKIVFQLEQEKGLKVGLRTVQRLLKKV